MPLEMADSGDEIIAVTSSFKGYSNKKLSLSSDWSFAEYPGN
jgi:hypothetical protein